MKVFKPTYSLLDVMMASPTQPLTQDKRDHHLIPMYSGLNSIERGESPVPDDWRAVCDAVNMMETLVTQGKVLDSAALLQDASTALAEAATRTPIRLTAVGIRSVRAVLEDYAAVLLVLPQRDMYQCHRATERRIREIQTGKVQAHDVRVVKL